MKRNFFKKLSFVLASAMVLTTLAPASGALAAGKPKLNSSSKYLHLGRVEEKQNEYNFNIKNKGKGWKYEWTSANEDVAEVNAKNGVTTATGVGKTTVSVVISDKDGEEVTELKAKVTVRDNIETVKISNLPTEAIAVGEEKDFNRSYVTESGNDKKTSGVTRWEVTPDTATINDKGVFVATEAGEYTITANSFQSKSKYTAWLESEKKDADLVTATTSEKVTVSGGMVEAKQADLDTFKVTFNSAVTDVKDKLSVYQMVSDVKVKELVSGIKMDTDNKVATVDMYSLVEGATYVVEYPDMESVFFVAATTKTTDVASIKVKTTQVEIGEEKELEVEIFNADGVNIANDDLRSRVDFETEDDDASLVGSNLMTMYKIGDTAKVTATFHTYNYSNTTGEEIGNITAIGIITCVEEIYDVAGNIKAYTVEEVTTNPDFDDVTHTIASNDNAMILYVQLDMVVADGDDFDFSNADTEYAEFEFKSSNENILLVDEVTGALYPIKSGSAVVVVKYDEKTVGAVAITVTADRKLASVRLDSNSVILSNGVNDEAVVGITVKDQYGEDFDDYDLFAEVYKTPADATEEIDLVYTADGGDDVAIQTVGSKTTNKGKYSVKITVADGDNEKVAYITVDVKEPTDLADIAYYAIETDKTSYDVKVKDDTTLTDLDLNVRIFAYDKKGIKVNEKSASDVATLVKWSSLPNASGDFRFEPGIKNAAIGSDNIVLAKTEHVATVSGDAIIKASTGTYRLVADEIDDIVVRSTTFKVVDTQDKPVLTIDKTSSEESDVIAAIKDCITIKYNREEATNAQIVIVDDRDFFTATGYSVRVKKVLYKQTTDAGEDLYHEVTVDQSFRYNQ